MNREEFEERTGFYPDERLYRIIEKHYMEYDLDKDQFCKKYKTNEDNLAWKIQREADLDWYSKLKNEEYEKEEFRKRMEDVKLEAISLKEKLEKELEWKPYEDSQNVLQIWYQELENSKSTEKLTDEEAIALLADWFGFEKSKIQLVKTIPVYEVNRHSQLRRIGKLDRVPLYNASDWNYIRFDCGKMRYEMKNGTLQFFYD